MQPVAEFHQPLRSIAVWDDYDSQVRANLTSTAIILPGGAVLIDPTRLTPDAFELLTATNPITAIVLSNGNHTRSAVWYQELTRAPILASHAAGRELDCPVDRFIGDGDIIADHLTVIELPGAGPGEIALLCPFEGGTVCLGDTLINLDATGFTFLPDKYCAEPRLAKESLNKLLPVSFQNMTFAHGLPLIGHARTQLQHLLQNS